MKSGSRRIAVTGATGFVGWAVAERLRDDGLEVRALVRQGSRKPVPQGIEARTVAFEPGPLRAALEGCDAVVHAAGVIRAANQAGFDAGNVAGTQAVVAGANGAAARLVLISSLAAAGAGTVERPACEDHEPKPLNAYGRSKLAGERVVREQARVSWTIIRPPAVYGPRDRGFLPLFRMAARGVFIQAVRPAMPFRFIYIDDLARGVALAATDDAAGGEVLYLAHPQTFTSEELLRELAAVFGRPYRPWRMPPPLLSAAAVAGDLAWRAGVKPLLDSSRLAEFRAAGFVCSVDRARQVLGFAAEVGLREGLERTASWYRGKRWI
jgi:nucleoside-diphosphate-sugar epimerase